MTKKDFKWSPDTLEPLGSGSDKKAISGGPDALGHALEAATTGHAWDAANPVLRRGVGTSLVVGPAAGIAVATAVPLLMETSGEAVNTAYGNHTLQYLKDHEFKNDGEALQSFQLHEGVAEEAAVLSVLDYSEAVGMTLAVRMVKILILMFADL